MNKPKTAQYRCHVCGTTHEINIGSMMVQLSLEGKTPEELRERTRKATEASAKARKKKLSTVKKKKVLQ